MRLVSIKSIGEGEKLGKAIYNDNGQILLHRGAILTKRVLGRLNELGIPIVYIQDERTKDIEHSDMIKEETKQRAIQTIKSEFTSIADDMRLNKTFSGEHLSKGFSQVVHAILDDLKLNQHVLSVLSDVIVYDDYVFTHSLNVTVYTLGIAIELNYNEKQMMEIGLGAILHDVGKMVVPLAVLQKPGRLSTDEFKEIQAHAQAGFDVLRKLPNIPLLAAHCAFQHHERLDGSGYPQGLKGDSIHEYAKIIAIADVFDAVTSSRVYRKPMLPHEALELLYSGVENQFDKSLVEAFRRTIAMYPVGLTVTLSDDRVAIVVKQNKELSTHPVVRVIKENGVEVDPYDIDLMEHLNITIVEIETMLAKSEL